jgi:RimJ/RimL family protein N-acetyltransferase
MGRQRDEGRYGELAITDAGGFAGSLTLHSLDWKNRRGELGFWIVPSARRRGLARAAVRLALRWTFRDLDLERVELTTTPENDAVARLAGRLGFTREGLLRGRNLERGRRVDVVVFGLLRDEWREGLSDRA